jgi:acetolactate synthase-1/3 small subunit
VFEAINVFRAKAIDLSPESIIVEITGQSGKLNAFLKLVEPYGILELSRTGTTALERGKTTLEQNL